MSGTLQQCNFSRYGFLLIAIGLACCPALYADDDKAASAEDIEFFEKKVRPVLVNRCYSCHSSRAKTIQGGLRVDSMKAMLEGGDSGPAVLKKNPTESLLIQAIQFDSDADFQMPPKGKLPDREIAALTEWIRRGAPYPIENADIFAKKKIDFDKASRHWSFVPLKKQPLPATRNSSWPLTRLDHFVLAKMEEQKLKPSAVTDKATWLRRVTFDLTGLPPTLEELEDFLKDESESAYEVVVDRLLESPHYGERWARIWLDMARYTDRTAGWLKLTAQAHLYRDWVVQAMNKDMPYDQFIKRQLATDLMPGTGPEDTPALGFLGLSPTYWKELKLPSEIIKVIVADEWEERIDTVSRTFLGLTVACARCHDHKFDAITMQDYYAMAGVFASSRIEERPVIEDVKYAAVRKAKTEILSLQNKIKDLQKKNPASKDQINQLTEKISALKQTPYFNSPLAPGVIEESVYVHRKGETAQSGTRLEYKPSPRNLNLFIRGNPNRLGEVVPRRFLTVLSSNKNPVPFQQGSGRLELAEAITTDASSLTARVWVNRIWKAHFGTGLVSTPSNFGQSGTAPSHPELLDDLAFRLIENGWTVKQLHREIVLSATYRQVSKTTQQKLDSDPENKWFSRMNRIRLPVESWRDAMFVVAGDLDRKLGGPSVELTDPANHRRTIYSTIHRREMSNVLLTHDFPDPNSHSPNRVSTITSLQGLYALNGQLMLNRSSAFANRILESEAVDTRNRIALAYRILFARRPTENEIKLGISFLNQGPEKVLKENWTRYVHVLIASNEFAFVN